VKNRFSEVVDRLQQAHGRVVITKRGHPAAVVISLDDLESRRRHSTLAIEHRSDVYRPRQSLRGAFSAAEGAFPRKRRHAIA